jgi:hypothetical protein
MRSMNKEKPEDHWLYKGVKKVLSSKAVIQTRVERGPGFHAGELDSNADYLIGKKLQKNTAYGVITGVVGIVPVMGTIGAVAASATVEFAAVTHQELELCMELAHNYGHDINQSRRVFETLAIIGRKRTFSGTREAKEAAVSKGLDSAVKKLIRIGLFRAIARTTRSLELRFGVRSLSKAVPVLGVALGGAINYKITRNTATLAKDYYRSLTAEDV